jgi:hypothetical protein
MYIIDKDIILFNENNQKLLQGVQMLHGTVFSKRVPLAAGGKRITQNPPPIFLATY